MKGRGIALLGVAGLVMLVFFAFFVKNQPQNGEFTSSKFDEGSGVVINQSETSYSEELDSNSLDANNSQSAMIADCEIRQIVLADGSSVEGMLCPSITQGQQHPYEDALLYSNDALQVLSDNNDAKASAVLGMRLIGTDLIAAYDLLVKAAAIDDNPDHLMMLSDQGFGATSINGELNKKGTGQRYILAATAEMMSENSPQMQRRFEAERLAWEELMREEDIPEETLSRFNRQAVSLYETIKSIQQSSGQSVQNGGSNNV
jgi:hypothetical protein